MRMFVPDQFKHPGKGFQRPTNKREAKRREDRKQEIALNANPGNSHYLIFPPPHKAASRAG